MRIYFCAIALLMGMSAGDAAADAAAGQGYFSVMGSYIDGDDDRNVDEGVGGQFGFGKALNQHWNVEAFYAAASHDSASGEASTEAFGLDFQLVFKRDDRFSPYVHAGLGAFTFEPPRQDSETGGMVSAGLGFYLDLFDSNSSLRAEWKYREDKALSRNLADNIFSIGFHLPFGRAKAPVVLAAAPLDSDNDGVSDDADACPGTPAGARVDSNGCEYDADGDGVSDSADECPNTVTGAVVDSKGCELDSDGDGVVDRLDECPGTAPGTQVNNKGCEIKDEVVLEGVNFESNSDRLVAGATDILDDVAASAKLNPTIKFEIGGHTDSDGEASYNEGLSTRRAQTVFDYLVAKGIAEDRMSVRGYGESQPIADNGSSAGKAENRRVVLRLTER